MRSPILTLKRARVLRRAMMAPEAQLWALLRRNQRGLRFRRQHPIGPYILDFYCPAVRLCVEVDGPVHDELEQMEHDLRRTKWLELQGIRVLRFSDREVMDRPVAVLKAIEEIAANGGGAVGTLPLR